MTASSSLLRALVEVVECAGIPRDSLFSAARLSPERLEERSTRLEEDEVDRMQIAAIELTGDPALGLHLAERTSEAAFDVVAHLLAHAPTLREALGSLVRFGSLVLDGFHLSVEERVDTATIRYAFPRASILSDRLHAEFAVMGFLRLLRSYVGQNLRPFGAHFEHPSPRHRPEYARLFGGAERFEEPFTGLSFPRALLDTTQMHRQPELYSALREEAERALLRLGRVMTDAERVTQYLRARPPSRMPTMEAAARTLGMSPRSLRRRLSMEGTSYRALSETALTSSAVQMLREPRRSVQETAYAVGFSDPAAFHRAFKRWTGMTPRKFQKTKASEATVRRGPFQLCAIAGGKKQG